jgi:hypothetical protein
MKDYTIGKYQYSKYTVALASILLVAGIAYGITTKKNAMGVFVLAMAGSITGFAIGMIAEAPKRVKE